MIVTVPDNETAAPSEPASNSTIAAGASSSSNSSSNSTSNSSSNSTGNTTGNSTANDTAYANVTLNGPSA